MHGINDHMLGANLAAQGKILSSCFQASEVHLPWMVGLPGPFERTAALFGRILLCRLFDLRCAKMDPKSQLTSWLPTNAMPTNNFIGPRL